MINFNQEKRDTTPLAGQVAERISEMIKSKNLIVGERLPNEFELAEQLNVGRGTIREAVKLLVARNILVIERGKGTFVRQMPGMSEDPLGLTFMGGQAELAYDLLQVRLQIEPWCASMAAENITEEQPDALRKQYENLSNVTNLDISDQERRERYIEEDIKLHTLIGEASGNRVVPRLIPVICTGVDLFSKMSRERPQARYIAMDTHKQVVKCIVNHQAGPAKEAMRNHLLQNMESIKKYLGNKE